MRPDASIRKKMIKTKLSSSSLHGACRLALKVQGFEMPRRYWSCNWWKSKDCLCVSSGRPKPYVCDYVDRVDDVHRRVQKWLRDRKRKDPESVNLVNPIFKEFSKENIAYLMKDLAVPYCVLLKLTSSTKGGFGGSGGCLKIEKRSSNTMQSSTNSAQTEQGESMRSVLNFLVMEIELSGLNLARTLYAYPAILQYRLNAQ